MKMWKYPVQAAIYLLMSCGLPACTPVVKLLYGVKSPRYESAADIRKFSEETFGNMFPLCCYTAEGWIRYRSFGMPNVIVFDRTGRYIPYADTSRPNCNGPADVFIRELDPLRQYHANDSIALRAFLNFIRGNSCDEAAIAADSSVDFTLFFTFALWTGKKIYGDKTLDWLKTLHETHTIKYRAFLLNTDFQECWKPEEKEMVDAWLNR